MDPNKPIYLQVGSGQLPPVQLPDPPAKRGRKAQTQGGPARKRSKKADGADGTTSGPESSSAAAAGGKPPTGRGRGGKAAGSRGGGRGGKSSSKQDKDDDDGLLLVEKEPEVQVEEEPEERLGKTHSGVFSKDLPWLMYGFGDADKPIKETVDLVEDIAVQFVTETVHAAMAAAAVRAVPGATGAAKQKSDVDVPDLLFAVRKDPRKVARVQELMRRQKEIIDARKLQDAVDVEGEGAVKGS